MIELRERLQAAVGNGYRIERELGGGGTSRVFLATELALHRSVVIKVLAPEFTSDVVAARFRQEFEITATLGQHPHILPVLSSGTNGGLLYYITPFIEGESLRHHLARDGRLSIDDVQRILSELASALAYAHHRGVVHRDVKPENVLLSDGHAILADFGISAVLGRRTPAPRNATRDPAARLTDEGIAVGTPGYMSPEQAAGDEVIDERSDLYSLAVIGYELLCGAPPFTGTTPAEVMNAHLHDTPRPIAALRPDTPQPLVESLGILLRKSPDDRLQTADEFHDALRRSVSGPTAAATAAGRVRRRRLAGIAATLLAAAVTAFVLHGPVASGSVLPNLVAIAPFEAFGADLGIWREGLVDLLAANLDGAGPIRTVPPSVVVRRAPERMDRNAARELAERTNAGIAVYGSLIAAGEDSVRVTATLVETATGRSTDIQLKDAAGRMDRLADSLSMAILRELGRTRAIGATRLSTIGSSSLPALKAYLQGEQFYRRSDWDSATVHYQRAVALDPDFAPALRHLSNAMGWKLAPEQELSNDGYQYALLAGAKNRGLAPRESLLVAADSIFAALQLARYHVQSPEWRHLVERLTTLLDQGVRRFPDDPEIWFKAGDVHYHFTRFTFPSRSNTRVARNAFERSIALDSAFAPAYIHQIELAASDQDVLAVRRSTAAYLALDPGDVHGASMRLVRAFLEPGRHRGITSDSLIATAPVEALQQAFGIMVALMDSAETQVTMARTLRDASRAGRVPSALRRGAAASYVNALLLRGRVTQALTATDSTQWLPLLQAAFLRVVPRDSAVRVFARRPDDPAAARRLAAGAVLWSLADDSVQLTAALRLADSAPPSMLPAAMLAGLRAMERRDTTAAIAAFTLADTTCAGWCWEARLPLAFLLSSQRRDREAATILEQDFAGWPSLRVLWMLERARVNERLGILPRAVDSYAYVANAWRNADPALQPYVAEAREALQRLSTDPGRA